MLTHLFHLRGLYCFLIYLISEIFNCYRLFLFPLHVRIIKIEFVICVLCSLLLQCRLWSNIIFVSYCHVFFSESFTSKSFVLVLLNFVKSMCVTLVVCMIIVFLVLVSWFCLPFLLHIYFSINYDMKNLIRHFLHILHIYCTQNWIDNSIYWRVRIFM